MKLEEIGFYTLSDSRAATASHESPLSRCELVLTARCNFKCPYCRSVGGGDLPFEDAEKVVRLWASQGLKNIRFSGGEPTLWKGLPALCRLARGLGVERVAVSTNGSAARKAYEELLESGVNDFSVSLDACCAEDGDRMAGGVKGAFDVVKENIKWLAAKSYLTVGVVLTDANKGRIGQIVEFADSLGVSDIRVIPAAQDGDSLACIKIDEKMLEKHKILRYRSENIKGAKPVRGLRPADTTKCGLVLDDMAVNQGKHYPCIIYMREGGKAIGEVGEAMREERKGWHDKTNTHLDPICKGNCLDVCVDYNNQFANLRASAHRD